MPRSELPQVTGSYLNRLKMQPAQEQFLPRITQHIDDEIVHFADGRIGLVLKLDGTLFEGINDRIIINQYLNLNTVFSELGKGVEGRLGLWLTLHRRRINFEREMKFHNVFAKQFAKKYMQRFEQGEYFENTYYIAVVLKYTDIDEGKIELHRIKSRLLAGMATYSPEVLSVYFLHNDEKKIKLNEIPDEDEQINEDEEIIRPTEDDILFSEVYEFVGLLANGVQQRIPLSNKDAYTTIAVSDLHFGNEIVEIRCPNQTKFAALYDLKDFGKSKMKALNPLLNLDCEFIFTQSFVYIGKTKAAEKIKAQLNRMEDTGEVFGDEQQDLIDAQNYLSSGSVMFGDYHAALTVYGETAKSADRNSQKVVSAFQITWKWM